MRVGVHADDKDGQVGQAYDIAANITRIEIWPLAEEGQGVMRIYGRTTRKATNEGGLDIVVEDGLITSIILKSMKRITATCAEIHPDIAALIPAPVQQDTDGSKAT